MTGRGQRTGSSLHRGCRRALRRQGDCQPRFAARGTDAAGDLNRVSGFAVVMTLSARPGASRCSHHGARQCSMRGAMKPRMSLRACASFARPRQDFNCQSIISSRVWSRDVGDGCMPPGLSASLGDLGDFSSAPPKTGEPSASLSRRAINTSAPPLRCHCRFSAPLGAALREYSAL